MSNPDAPERKCEGCNAPEGKLIYRDPKYPLNFTIVPDPISEVDVYRIFGGKPIKEVSKVVKVALEWACLDGNLANTDPNNIAAFCQYCRGELKAKHRRKERRAEENPDQLKLWED